MSRKIAVPGLLRPDEGGNMDLRNAFYNLLRKIVKRFICLWLKSVKISNFRKQLVYLTLKQYKPKPTIS